jgi:hypothetical protein
MRGEEEEDNDERRGNDVSVDERERCCWRRRGREMRRWQSEDQIELILLGFDLFGVGRTGEDDVRTPEGGCGAVGDENETEDAERRDQLISGQKRGEMGRTVGNGTSEGNQCSLQKKELLILAQVGKYSALALCLLGVWGRMAEAGHSSQCDIPKRRSKRVGNGSLLW